MRKYLLNPGFVAAIVSGIGVVKMTREGPRDWRLGLLWASWGIGIALAVGSVLDDDKRVRAEELDRELGL
ncbi:hypothetical protein GCM10009846_07450 [Agrococcus versicolor]|uniref:Uncharacterized protein n=1 Tax=Agrococcus versicolor TaxID=501482 RepID=A0ABN3AMA9_9MICO